MSITNEIYQFLFHPWSDDHSPLTKVLATITDIALTALTAGIFAVVFAAVQWKDRKVTVVSPLTRASKKADKILGTKIKEESKLSDKAKTVKKKQAWQLAQFERWADAGQWNNIHSAHYDWWMFPIDRSSAGQGSTYQVNKSNINQLKQDPEFMKNYRRGVELVAKAWGWDVIASQPIDSPTKDQKWQNWPVRLGKMADSLRLFGEEDLRASMRQYALHANLQLEGWILQALSLQ
jgi:hypothetical protein